MMDTVAILRARARLLLLSAGCACAGAGAWCASAAAQAQPAAAYPVKPIRMLIPSPPGGGTDILGRLLQGQMTEMWNQSIVVDNRGGASGHIAAAAAARAAPDGYTLFFTYGGVITTGLPLYGKLAYDPMRDLAPVAMMSHVPGVLVAHPSFPAKTVGDIIKMAKAKPGAMTHGSASIGSSSHMNISLLKYMAGIDMVQVSYPGDTPSLVALLGGHVPFAFSHVVASLPHIQSGKLRALAVATAQRIPTLPDVPTVAESGLPGYEGLLFYLLMAPSKTPAPIVTKLHDAVTQIKQTAVVKQRFAAMGAVSFDMAPQDMAPFLQRELDKWTRVIKTVGIKVE
jgi:tripartite-type tricarboxylate transporter receptor subunit TctC